MAGLRGLRLVIVASAVVIVAACGSSSSKGSASVTTAPGTAPHAIALHGTYVQPAVTPEDLKVLPGGKKASYRVESGTTWHGDLEGTTKFVMHGVADVANYASTGTNDEVFTGSVKDIGSGHLHLFETWTTSAAGNLSLDARIVGSDGELAGLHGTMHFAGHGDPKTGAGTGTYTANSTR